MPIPYMGSKQKSAQKIYQTILNFNSNKGTLVDLFCGGFAISEKFLENGWSVISNDKNIHVIELLRKVIFDGLPEEIVTKFVTRELFYDIQKNPSNYEAWYVGYVQCCYSFGNNQKDYLFGKDVEPIKHSAHKLVVDKDPSDLIGIIPQKYIDGILKQSNWNKRRTALQKVSGVIQKRCVELQRLQQLQRLQRLQQLQQLQQLERLEVFNGSYNDVIIPEGAVIYCDPPYKGTAEYKEGAFNHSEFWEWARNISKTHKIYISEYSAPDDFETLLKFTQKSTLQGGSQQHDNQPKECIWIPKGQEKFKNIVK